MSLALSARISIGTSIVLRFAERVVIESSWQKFTDTAEIAIPRNIRIVGDPDGIKKYIKSGDPVTIELGYDDEMNVEFVGFVSRLDPSIPMVIYCEDYSYHLKRVSFTQSWKAATLNDIVSHVHRVYMASGRPPIKINVQDTGIVGAFVFEGATIMKALETIKDTCGFYSYFRGDTLYVGFPYQYKGTRKEIFNVQKNLPAKQGGLEYRLTEDMRIKVKAISNLLDGQKITAEMGDPDGEERTMNYYNCTLSELKKRAENEMALLKRSGYRGHFVAFGIPFVQHGDTAILQDASFTEKDGEYAIDGVKTSWTAGGFRRQITIGNKLA